MKYIIDTSTLLSLVRYYEPFDDKLVLYTFFRDKILSDEFIIIDKVSDESKYTSKGIITNKYEYIKDAKYLTSSKDILPDKKFFNMLENQFCNRNQKKHLQDIEIEALTNIFIKSADAKIILTAINIDNKGEDISIVTEETVTNNDNKLFQKIPKICSTLNIKCITLPQLIKNFDNEIAVYISN